MAIAQARAPRFRTQARDFLFSNSPSLEIATEGKPGSAFFQIAPMTTLP